MYSHIDEVTGAITGVLAFLLTHLCNFHLLQIKQYPILSELLIDSIRLCFTVAAAGIGYLVVHWIKTNITHEISKKKKRDK